MLRTVDHFILRHVDVGATSVKVVSENKNRILLRLMNDGMSTMYLGVDRPAVLHEGILLPAGSSVVCEYLRMHEVYAIQNLPIAQRLLILEGT